uniref:BRO-P n=1 Tax=Lymantria dispar multicapsid nuclear polyhedrosis virus TaxID=10449 RepID=A0A140HR47_NPVLD|nr:BRO-P [Lymantria dispar multiple nucleopolyhedrovirus]QDE15010.1 bro-p [Lymantria dispar multiple nucleopolyhedrovirus]
MARVKIGEFKFGEDTFTLRYVLEGDQQVKFVAKDVAVSLRYERPADAVSKHVDIKYKSTYAELGRREDSASNSVVKKGHPLYLQPHTVLISKIGILQLISRSKMPNAAEFQDWFYSHVLPACLRDQSAIDLMHNAEKHVNLHAKPILGYVYVATTPTYAELNLYKIGQTVNLNQRLNSLNCGRAAHDQMQYVLQTEPTVHHTLLEKLMKHELKACRNSGEVFCTDFEHIKRALESCLQQLSQN